jgi:hypothetical protein
MLGRLLRWACAPTGLISILYALGEDMNIQALFFAVRVREFLEGWWPVMRLRP